MYNAFVLHRWVFNKLFPRRKYKLDFGDFIFTVTNHFIIRDRQQSSPYRNPLKRVRTLLSETAGPSGEARVVDLTKNNVCPGGDLERGTEKKKSGGIKQKKCKYCWNSGTKRVRRESSWQCSLCKVSLCVTCNYKYHDWLKFSGKE